MPKNITSTLALLGCAFICIALLTRCNSGTGTRDSYLLVETSPESLCLVRPYWFPHGQTPPPEEGEKSPFADSVSTNQIFHQWSWQKFLWLTRPDKDGKPLFLNEEIVMQVDTAMQPVKIPSGASLQLQSTIQAGSMHPVLKTNPDYNEKGKSETVYYSIHVNEKMYNSSMDFVSKIASDTTRYLDNHYTFPVGSFELKAAWVPVEAIPHSKRSFYYKTMAAVGSTTNRNTVRKEVALIGMHVIGVVQNHPEFIWATFEHSDLAPDYNWMSDSVSAPEDRLLFRKGTVSGLGGIVFDTATQLGASPYQVFSLFKYGVPLKKGGDYMKTPQPEPANYENIQGINKCVRANLHDVWQNYFYNGSVWLNMDKKSKEEQAKLIVELKSRIGRADADTFLRGSLNCANVTMESFTQTFQKEIDSIQLTNLANCFTCHKAQSFSRLHSSPLYLSHIFQGFLLKKLGKTPSETDQLKTKDEERILQSLKQGN